MVKDLLKGFGLSLLILAIALVIGLALSACSTKEAPVLLNGAGASFPFPIYSLWTHTYAQDPNSNTLINYQSVGSGAGIKQVSEGVIDFGGSDEPLTIEQLREKKLFQLPMVAGAVAVVFNIPGIEKLKLDSDSVVKIFQGKITKWNDPTIQALNEMPLPDLAIQVVHRADGSGTTWLFTSYLSDVSTDWKEHVGAAKLVSWPVGIAGKGNEGVSAYVQQVKGSIGYVEAAYAQSNAIKTISLKNKNGIFAQPSLENVTSTITNISWNPGNGFYQTLINLPGNTTWPIIGVSYVLIPLNLNAVKTDALMRYIAWCGRHPEQATSLGYVVIPITPDQIRQATDACLK